MTTDENPYRPTRKGSPGAYHVVVQGFDDNHQATRQTVAKVATEFTAFKRLIDVLQQWQAAHGAIRPGTKIAIVHTADGGTVFQAEYLGYQETLI